MNSLKLVIYCWINVHFTCLRLWFPCLPRLNWISWKCFRCFEWIVEIYTRSMDTSRTCKKPADQQKQQSLRLKLKQSGPIPKSASNDDLAVKEALTAAIGKFKHSIMIIRAIALALPYHNSFTQIRPIILVSLIQNLFKLGDSELISFVSESIYEIAAESLDGQGPLLFPFTCVPVNRALWLVRLGWFLMMFPFSIQPSKLSLLTLMSLNCPLSLWLFINPSHLQSLCDSQELKNLLSHLQKLAEQAEFADSRVILDFVLALLKFSGSCSASVQASIVLLLVEIGEIPRLEIANEADLLSLNSCLRASSPATQLMVLKFLTAFAASHSNAHSLVECAALMKTVWLLHFAIETDERNPLKNLKSLNQRLLRLQLRNQKQKLMRLMKSLQLHQNFVKFFSWKTQISAIWMNWSCLKLKRWKGTSRKEPPWTLHCSRWCSIKSSESLAIVSAEFKRLLARKLHPMELFV